MWQSSGSSEMPTVLSASMDSSERSLQRTIQLAWLITAMVLAYYVFVLTNGTFDLWAPEILGRVFNRMLLNLLHRDFTIDTSTIAWEAMVKDGKTHTYFGVFPAIVRLIFLPFLDLQSVFVSRLSVFLGITVSVVFSVKMWLCILAHVKFTRFSRHIFLLLLVSFFWSSPYLLIASNASVYHEPIIWAAAATAVFNYLLITRWYLGEKRPDTSGLYLMAAVAGICLHIRPHVAIGLYITLAALIAFDVCKRYKIGAKPHSFKQWQHDFLVRALGPLAVLALFGLAYLGVNYARWGDPFTGMYLLGNAEVVNSPARLKNLEEFGYFNFSRIPAALQYYLLGSPRLTQSLIIDTGTSFDWIEHQGVSMIFMSPIFMGLALLGLLGLFPFGRKNSIANGPLLMGLAGEATTVVLTLSFMALTLRYRMDLWAVTLLAAIPGFRILVSAVERLSRKTQNALLLIGWMATGLSTVITHLVLLQYKFSFFSLIRPSNSILEMLKQAKELLKSSDVLKTWLF